MKQNVKVSAKRGNPRNCTGPKTPAGKARSSMHDVTHGLRARTIVLPNETREDFEQIHDSLQEQYDPQNPAEQFLVDAAAHAQWKMVRAEVYETAAYDKGQSDIARAEFFRGMIRTQNSLARLYSKAYNELERIKTARRKAEKEEQTEVFGGSGGRHDEVEHRRIRLVLINPETGERRVDSRIQDGKRVEEFTYDDDELAALAEQAKESGQSRPPEKPRSQ
jgi:hypothetical protein